MNKRFMSLLLVLVMVFSLLPISAMAQVYIFDGKDAIELDFYRNSDDAKPFNTQRVLTSGINAIYDPGCELAENTVFLGWQVNGQGDVMDIAGVRAYVTAHVSTLAGDTLNLVASVSPVRYLVYNDESGRVVKTVAVILAENNNSWKTDVDYDYTPASVDSDFFGWKTSQTGTDVEYENKSVGEEATHPTSITLSESTTNLYPVCKSGYWVTFNENDKPYDPDTGKGNRALNENIHATYQPPVFVLDGETLNPNSGKYPVSAQGYEFVEWCDENGNRVTNVTEATTVYAKWNPTQVKYKVAYWQQNANDDGYSVVANSIYETTGTAGEFATYDKNKARSQYTSEHFTLNETKSDNEKVVIAGDGSAVKNVYFDRDQFTLTFGYNYGEHETGKRYVTVNRTFYLYSNEKGDQPNKQDDVEIEFPAGTYEISTFNDLYYYYDGWTRDRLKSCISGNNFYYNYESFNDRNDPWNSSSSERIVAEKESGFETVYKTITAKYGEYIGDQFPITDNGASAEWRWSPEDSDVFSNVLVYIDTMPAENVAFERNTSNAGLKYIQFFVEPLPGETGTEPHNGKTYVAYHDPIPAKYNFFTEAEDYVNLYGFEHDGSDPAFGSDGKAYVDDGGTLKLYYLRNKHTLSFNTGDSVKPADATVKYDEPMASYNPGYVIGETTRDRNGRPIIFQGWYDNAAYAGSPYDFSAKRMPDADVLLYAKWADARYAVQLQINEGQMPEGSATEFKVSYNGTVDLTNNPTKAGFEFAGWYTDPACTQRFNLDTQLNEKTVKDAYTDPKDSTVMGKLTLYAKWRQEMDTESYLTVAYDAANGTISGEPTYTDPLHYADQAEAIAQPAAKSAVTGESFAYWEILKPKSATDSTLVPSGVTVYPGAIFNVKMDDAVNDTVTLRAHYEASTGTHITWFGNGGTTTEGATEVSSADANLNAAISVKPADTFTREGYEFLGWARLNENDMKDGDSWKQDDDAAAANLWLKWDGEKYTAVKDGKTYENPDIAANELTPHHVLYAVWKEYEKVTYVADFNAKMKLAEEATITAGATSNSGTFSMDGTTAVYQLGKETTVSDGAQFIFKDVDTAKIHGKFYDATRAEHTKAPAKDAAWKAVTVVPASSVYYDDDLKNASAVTVGDGSGYNSAVPQVTQAVQQEKGIKTIKFYGTGIDVYFSTGINYGTVQAKVDGGNVKTMINNSVTTRYNVPTISYRDLECKEHTLLLNVTNNSTNIAIDGIRIYGAVSDQAAYANTTEQYAVYLSMREALVNDQDIHYAVSDKMDHTAVGALFVDDRTSMSTERDAVDRNGNPIYETNPDGSTKLDDNGNPIVKKIKVYDNEFQAYKANSPKNEIYLSKNQSITFQLTAKALTAAQNGNLWIGLSAPDESKNSGTVKFLDGKEQAVNSAVDMYYPISADRIGTNGSVTITNTGDNMISVTNMKITGNSEIYAAANASNAAPSSVPDGATVMAVEDVVQLVFEPVTLMTVKLAANNGVDPDAPADPGTVDPEDPGTPDQPDDPKPGWNDSAFNPMNILKTLFQSLLNGLGNLFKGLGNW